MKRFFSKVKYIWVKFLSVFCAVLISFITLHPVVTVIAVASGVVSGIISALEFAMFCADLYDRVSSFIESTPGCFTETKYLCFWMDMIKDSGISEEDFRAYYTEIITRSEEWALDSDEYKTYLLIQDTSAAGVSLDAICLLAYHDTGTTDYTIDDQADGDKKFKLSGDAFKKTVADYNSRYMPMPVPDQYYYTYHSKDVSYIKTEDKSENIKPGAPVYRFSYGWGGQGWSGVYILPYVNDDYYPSSFYGKYYFHFYSSQSDGSAYINCDVYNLSDGSLSDSFSANWLGSGCSYGLWISTSSVAPYLRLQSFSSDFNYFNDTDYVNGSVFDKSLSTYSYVMNATDLSCSSSFWTVVFNNGNFTPWNNDKDDWGYIMSKSPFELFANQTQIDFYKIPDNYVITISGDTIYDYSITNPDTGDSTTINNYITNNYNFPDKKDDDDSSGGGGGSAISGNVTVGGKVDVSGKIEIDTKPIDININVNSGSSSGGSSGTGEAVRFDEDVGLDSYYNWMQEQTTGFSGFMKSFFGWLPGDIVIMLCAGFALVIMARFLGR